MQRVRDYIELVRPANVVTAFADVLAGYALAGLGNAGTLPWLLPATACLYAGGIVLNDYFDRHLDRVERPERPIPSGRVSARAAATLGGVLLAAGVVFAGQATRAALMVAAAIAVAVLVYDRWGKRISFVAPLNMGLCRALNLLLGAAAVETALKEQWPIAVIPFAYIAGVTALSRGEVHGGGRRGATVALVSLSAALIGLALLVFRAVEPVIPALVLALLAWRVVPAFLGAWRVPQARRIREAVKRGVLSLVLVNAVIGTVYAGPVYGAAILATALVANWLARIFAVT
jgi:4-hydroxybenzoate polyprenyltransferase